jgi:hypothetical protein
MAISNYQKDGKNYWSVYLNLRSKEDPTLRVQKRILDLPSQSAAVTEEKKLLHELTEKLARAEGKGLTWENVVDRWELAVRSDESKPYTATTIIDNTACMRNCAVPPKS